MRLPQGGADLPQLNQRITGSCGDAKHIAQHGNADLETDAGQKSEEHGPRQKIGQEPQLENPGQQQIPTGQQRHQAGERHIVIAARHRTLRERTGDDRCGGRIRSHHQMARRAEYRESHQWQQQRIESGDDGHAGNAGIAENLRQIYRGQIHSRQAVAQRLAAIEWPQA